MKKVIKFKNMTVVIPVKKNETAEEIEDKLADAMESIGSRFTTYTIEITEESEGEQQ